MGRTNGPCSPEQAAEIGHRSQRLVGAVNVAYLGLGVVLLTLAVTDLLWTTLWVDGGAGPLTSSLMAATWSALKSVGKQHSRLLSLSGPLVLSLTLLTWVGLLWSGWVLVFSAGANALDYTLGPEPVNWVGRMYFVAYTMFTMGNGDFSPTGGVWRIATSLTTGSGMVLVTLSVTYLINVLRAVVQKRSFASSVHGVGTRSESFVVTGWNGDDFDEHNLSLETLASQLSRIASQHNAYPILHYYRSAERRYALPIAVAVFDDAMSLFRFGVTPEDRPSEPLVERGRSSVEDYLKSVYTLPIEPADQPPPAPDLTRLREAGVPTVPDEEFADALGDESDRRRRTLGVVDSQAWQWSSNRDS
ncbi:potassium channel family protein [Halosimplex aquaticum]|uniref:Potassium channel family protein n=1 Tax=Halosimplex aquaticum TaxID=3026162 RepID=A0ABD5XZ72_9EURY|nr:potassium channel family protein [Halosimplex aquaticum]